MLNRRTYLTTLGSCGCLPRVRRLRSRLDKNHKFNLYNVNTRRGETTLLPICIKDTGKYGRGVYATRDVKAGELIEASPVLVSCQDEWQYIKKTILFDYCFTWGNNYEHTAIALGYGSLFNHSYTPNATFVNNLDNLSIDFYAFNDIKEGEEITINYNEDAEDKDSLWFDVIE